MEDYIFVFTTTWHIPYTIEVVWNRIGMVSEYPTWWPGMKKVDIITERDLPVAIGNVCRFHVMSPLYSLSYTTRVTAYEMGKKIIAAAEGDLVGTGTWTFEEKENETMATFVWEVRLTPPFLRLVSLIPPVRGVMRFFHDRLMNAGERGLRQLLATSAEDAMIGAPWRGGRVV